MAYVDVSGMITALRVAPSDFAMGRIAGVPGQVLVHTPSKHKFMAPFTSPAIVGTQCDCGFLTIKYDQVGDLARAATEWRTTYWLPKLEAERSAAVRAKAKRAERWTWLKTRPAAALATVRAWFKPAAEPCHDILRRVEAGGDD